MKNHHKILLSALIIVIVTVLGYLLFQIPIGPPQQESGPGKLEAIATIYVKDPASSNFNVWNGLALGQTNPFPLNPDNGLSVILPAGEYYVDVEAEGYDKITSLITDVPEQSIVTADINLGRKHKLGDKIIATLSPRDSSNNFVLNVTALPQKNLLRIGEFLPIITAYDREGNKKVFLNEPSDKPVIVYVFSTWNTEAQEQMAIYEQVLAELDDNYKFIALSTMEPGSVNDTKMKRGDYEVEFYEPASGFYDDYYIISLPQFFLANPRGELIGIINGSHSAEELVNMIEEIYSQ